MRCDAGDNFRGDGKLLHCGVLHIMGFFWLMCAYVCTIELEQKQRMESGETNKKKNKKRNEVERLIFSYSSVSFCIMYICIYMVWGVWRQLHTITHINIISFYFCRIFIWKINSIYFTCKFSDTL